MYLTCSTGITWQGKAKNKASKVKQAFGQAFDTTDKRDSPNYSIHTFAHTQLFYFAADRVYVLGLDYALHHVDCGFCSFVYSAAGMATVLSMSCIGSCLICVFANTICLLFLSFVKLLSCEMEWWDFNVERLRRTHYKEEL